ncbi:unnamed protein product [Lactuca saligna]|uniref:Uncharacterized protein n=1 Tax=Lactuca saligna TaxID=75948 RepID=A0AA36EKR2_LACSI|nr:unnamed protein product [Lactuca saligna]
MSEMVGLRSRVGVELVPSPDITDPSSRLLISFLPWLEVNLRYNDDRGCLQISKWSSLIGSMFYGVPKLRFTWRWTRVAIIRVSFINGRLSLWRLIPLPYLKKHMRELAGLLPEEGENFGSSEPASSSQPSVGTTFLAHSPASASVNIHVIGQAGKITTPIRRKQSACVVLLSDKDTESDGVGLRPHKKKNTVFVPKLLDGIRDVLCYGISAPVRKEIVVVPRSSKTSASSFIDSLTTELGACSVLKGALGMSRGFPPSDIPYMVEKMRIASHPLASEAYIPIWAVTKDLLLLEYIAT